MNNINQQFNKVGGLIDKVSEKLTDSEYKDIYEALAELRNNVASVQNSNSGMYIKYKYAYRYVRYWYDSEEEKVESDISQGVECKIFKIKECEFSEHNYDDNIQVLLDRSYDPVELSEFFFKTYISTTSDYPRVINFKCKDEDEDDMFGYITVYEWEYI